MQQKQGTLEPAGPLDSGPHPFRPSDERHKTVCQDPPRGPGPSGALKGRSTYGTRQHPEPPPDPGPAWTPAPLASISRPRPTTLGAKVKPCRGPEVRSREKDPCNPLCITVPQGARCLSSSPTSEPSRTQHSPHSPRSPQTCASNHQPSPPTLPPPRSGPGPGPQPDNKTPGGSTPAGETNDFRVYIVTWNVGSAVPPVDITSLFGRDVVDGTIDMFIIGLQEVNSMINKRLKDALFTDQWSELFMETLGPFGYVLVASQRMQGVLLLAFSKFSHLPFLRDVQTEKTRTGLGGCWGNKGGVSTRMTMFGHPVCFLNCHLPAHMRNLDQRMEDFESILQQQQFEGGTATGVLDHDVVFWFGDLNFRIEDYDIHVVKCAVDSHKLPLLWERDQLNMAKNTALILDGFTEGPLNFPPTYKFDVGTHTYDTSAKKRKPAWTDRILWRLRRTGSSVPNHSAALRRGLTSWLGGTTKVTQHEYRSHMDYTVSDHKPVSAIFSLHFPFKVDIPLVQLQVEKEWCSVSDATVRFSVASSYQRSSWDWVALYKVGFRHHKDYVAFIWAKGEHVAQVTFPEEDIPREDGEYILGYYSNNMNTIVGMAGPIQLRVPVHSPTSGGAESSDVSSEDDSTLVLLSVSSRSPSPKNGGKHHHPRHSSRRSRSPAVPSNPLPSLQGLSLCPRPKDPPSGSRSPGSAGKKERLVSPDTLPSPSLSPLSPRSPISPRSPGGTVTVPEALVAAILGEHRPGPASSPLGGGAKRTGKHTHGDVGV
ncbi:inositol polyphosphate 5-phosphatase K [Gadus macrocephalus]|uniref:inositol polyphosphate 5-phosphatase K n=1 Tax=Gadus macrocephalus TaxID=80720 RepID=UPI0028CBB29F|nr:inositol polyphosphate 5-phosphatase K [Gadus macrocephalus]